MPPETGPGTILMMRRACPPFDAWVPATESDRKLWAHFAEQLLGTTVAADRPRTASELALIFAGRDVTLIFRSS